MNPNDVIDTYVADVARRVPAAERHDIGLELRDLLAAMLDDRAASAGRSADDAMVLAMLREFGTPAEAAARYHAPGMVIIPAAQTRSFATLAIGGVALQWAFTLPRVIAGQPVAAWWLSWGLGAFWWPGFMVMSALLVAAVRQLGWWQPRWRPRVVDADRISRPLMLVGLAWFLVGAGTMIALPWIAAALPAPLASVFALDPGFLHQRAWPALVLWLGVFALRATVCAQGRWRVPTRRLDVGLALAWLALLLWWIIAGDIFQATPTTAGAKAGLLLVGLIILVDLAMKWQRRRTPLRVSKVVG